MIGFAKNALSLAVAGAIGLMPLAGAGADDLPVPQGGYGSYTLTYSLPGLGGYSTEDTMSQLTTDFDEYFTFTGCGRHLRVGEVCELDFHAGRAPVEVVAIGRDGFALRSLPGHPEGAGRTILFRFVTADVPGNASRQELQVSAWGPVRGAATLGPLNSATVARGSWAVFAHNIDTRFPDVEDCAVCGGAV